MVTDHIIVRALQVKQYSNRPGAKIVCFGGHKTFEGILTLPRPDAFGMRHQSGEYFAPNPMLSSFNTDFVLKFVGEDQTNKKLIYFSVGSLHEELFSG